MKLLFFSLFSIQADENDNTNLGLSSTDENDLSTNNLYKDFSGIDTESFITTTLKNNPKDRTLLLTLEKVFQDFISNQNQTSYQFQAMNSCKNLFLIRIKSLLISVQMNE